MKNEDGAAARSESNEEATTVSLPPLPATSAAEAAVAPPPVVTEKPTRRGGVFGMNRASLVFGGVGVVVGALIVSAIMTPMLISSSSSYAELSAKNDKAESDLTNMNGTLAQARRERDSAAKRADAADQKASELKSREDAVSQREDAVKKSEETIAANSFSGGVMVVGQNVAAGTYRTGQLTDMCYYAWKTSTEADADIVDNNIVKEGTATATLRDGQVFESNGCGTWTKVG